MASKPGTGGSQSAPVLILGGRSEIGLEVARRLAPGRTVVLAARRAGDLDEQVAALSAAGALGVHTVEFDADDLISHAALLDSVTAEHGEPTTVVLAFGILGDQARAETDPSHAVDIIHTD
ncbi:MAG: SDR family NAD(P)-dependent oxidoreductase, partial [Microthrixaceae bacterium]